MNDQAPRTYSPGDTIRLDYELSDESGVAKVTATCVPDKARSGERLELKGDGNGEKRTTVTLEGEVEQSSSPGRWLIHHITAYDTAGNISEWAPDPTPEFYIERAPGDHEGPEPHSWDFS